MASSNVYVDFPLPGRCDGECKWGDSGLKKKGVKFELLGIKTFSSQHLSPVACTETIRMGPFGQADRVGLPFVKFRNDEFYV